MGDGDEGMKTSPRLFFVLRMTAGRCVPSLGCLLLIRSLCPSGVVLPALLVVCRGVRRGVVCRAVVRGGGACRSSLVPPCRVAGRSSLFLVSALSSVCGSLCVPRLDTQCGRLLVCPAGFVSVIGTGGGTEPLLAWMRRAGEYGDYVDRLLSVDYSGAGVYINTRALMVSPFFVSWHVLVVWAAFLCFCCP